MGIAYKVRADGSLAVSRRAVELVLGGISKSEARKGQEPDFGALYGT
jgi:hypothetical protein